MPSKNNDKLLILVAILVIISLTEVGLLLWKNFGNNDIIIQPIVRNQNGQPKKEMGNAKILKLFFPTKALTQTKNRPDCFYDPSTAQLQQVENPWRSAEIYCVSNIVEKNFMGNSAENILAVIRYGINGGLKPNEDMMLFDESNQYPTSPHAMGIEHAFLGVIDPNGEKIISNVQQLSADSIELNFYDCQNKAYIVSLQGTAWQGYGASNVELIWIENGIFQSKTVAQETGTPQREADFNFQGDEIKATSFDAQNDETHLYDLIWNKNTCNFIKQ
ncbi:MAG: hypothetical protein PHN39_00495 [Candidatus Pacebacteria bacterium]|nr:hypothetical protein [Candidatus Paceibacterota bacterium]